MESRTRTFAILVTLVVVAAPAAEAQRFGRGRFGACQFSWDKEDYFISPFFAGNPQYDGRVTFARIKYRGNYECGGQGPGWSHDYPRTDSHFAQILKEITAVRPFVESGPVKLTNAHPRQLCGCRRAHRVFR